MEREPESLVDFAQVPRRLQTAVVVAAALSLLGCVVDGAINGLTFALMGRWGGIFVLLALACGAVVTAAHALGGADRAGRRGERLAGPDVGLSPRRFEGRGLLHKADVLAGADDEGEDAGREQTKTVGDTPADAADAAHLEDTARLDPIRSEGRADS